MTNKSEYSIKLERRAQELADPSDDFVTVVSLLPQRDGVDKDLWEWVEEQGESLTLPDFEYMRLRMCADARRANGGAE